MGFSRQEYWSGLPWPPPGDLPNPGIEPKSHSSLELADRFFNTSNTWEVQISSYRYLYLSIYLSIIYLCFIYMCGLPECFSGKEFTCQCRRCGFGPWVGKISWRRKWQPTPVFLPGKSPKQRSLVGYSPWGLQRVRHD